MLRPPRVLASLLLALCLPAALKAHASTDHEVLTEEDFLGEAPIVLSATRLAQPLADSPAPVTVIDREMIEASGIREIHELFRLVPGFQVGSQTGAVHTVTHHGLSDQFNGRLQVLVDGRSVYNPITGSVEWTELPLAIEDIDRIEVVRGPNAATYGSNAFTGVISIYTRHASEDLGLLKLTKGSDGIEEGLVRFADSLGDLDYRLTLRYQSDHGFDDVNDSKRVRLATLRTDYQLSLREALEFQLGYTDGPRGTGFEPTTTHRDANFQLVRWRHVPDSGNEIVAQFYRNFDRIAESREPKELEIPGVGPATRLATEANGDSTRYDAEVHQVIDPGGATRWVWGGSYRYDEAHAPLFFGTESTLHRATYRLFGNLEWRLRPDLLVNAGLMWEDNDYVDAELSPRLAVNYHLTPHQTLRASVSRATGTPTFFEHGADYYYEIDTSAPRDGMADGRFQVFSTPGRIDSQKVISRELGYVAEFPRQHLRFDASIFRNALSGLISSAPISPSAPVPLQWLNRDDATVTGAEAHLDWRPTSNSRLVVGYGYADTDSSDAEFEASTAKHSLSALAIYRFTPSWTGSAAYYRVSTQQWLETGTLIPGYDRLDLRLAYRFSYAMERQGEVALVAQNVLDDYADFSTANQFDTRTLLTLKLEM